MVLTIVILVCLSAIGASKTTLMITKKNRTNSRISATATNTTTTNAYATDAAPTTPTIRRLSPTSDIEDRVRNTVKKININPLGIC